ncbi:endolysin [Microbacterium phage Fizzles]|nr:endolysin [Microbacterium phage Fizzles]
MDGVAAARTMLGFRTWRKGHCLEAVWAAYKANGARATTTAPTATAGWHRSAGKHPGDRNPPAGVPVWWGEKPSSAAGDVVISLGDGRVVATDWPYNGVINVTTIALRERQIARPYLGWTEEILGAPIDFARPGQPSGGITPADPKDDDVSTTAVKVAISPTLSHFYTIDHEFISHNDTIRQNLIVAQVDSTRDEVHTLGIPDFELYLDGKGIPRDVVRYKGDGAVLNPQSGKYEGNGTWSRARQGVALDEKNAADLAAIRKLLAPAATK